MPCPITETLRHIVLGDRTQSTKTVDYYMGQQYEVWSMGGHVHGCECIAQQTSHPSAVCATENQVYIWPEWLDRPHRRVESLFIGPWATENVGARQINCSQGPMTRKFNCHPQPARRSRPAAQRSHGILVVLAVSPNQALMFMSPELLMSSPAMSPTTSGLWATSSQALGKP